MSPEQANGQEVSEQADVWSLSVVLYEIITGQRPFAGTNLAAILLAVHTRAPVPTTALAAGDEELWAIISRGLEKSLAARWPSVAALGRALAEWATHRGVATDAGGAALSSRWGQQSSDSLINVAFADASRGPQPSLMSVLSGEALRSMELSLSATSIMPPVPVEMAPALPARPPGDVETPFPGAADSISPSACRAVPVRRARASWVGAITALAVAPLLVVPAVQGYRPWAASGPSAEAADRAGVLIDQASRAADPGPAPTPLPTPLPRPVDRADAAHPPPSASSVRVSHTASGARVRRTATAMPLPAAPSF